MGYLPPFATIFTNDRDRVPHGLEKKSGCFADYST
ncbi:hypothetical protein OCA8868_01069 [Octadecabacter ascidiaceicola]|uniref:Uncharacterized protein n=1 Tax=Octadecabacter ascidiaceicola TaxID=1655543 RepID=A0A238K3P2_9RHOB|nr:hypothetical protein OCA8868_01069 [Octadecabacter ascidiaceicola]